MYQQKAPPLRPSVAWLDQVFNSPPRREVKGRSRPTQRFAFESDSSRNILYAEGGNELTAMLLFEHLWRIGYLIRYKPQAFDLLELGGPSKVIPDFLVELTSGEVYVVEVKSAKYLTEDVLERFNMHRNFLKNFGISHLLWTDCDSKKRTNKLNRQTWHSVRHVHRGRAFELDASTRKRLEQCIANGAMRLGDFWGADLFTWDQLMAAIHKQILNIDITKEINENTQIFPSLPVSYYEHLFKEGNASAGWWDALSSK